MVFFSRFGSILKQSVSKQFTSQVSASKPSTYQALRCISSSKLFVGGLPWGVDDSNLRHTFSHYGHVVEARVIIDREQNGSRGFGFVTFASTEEASSAIQAMDGQDLLGRRVRVNYATEQAPHAYDGGNSGGGGGGYGGRPNYGGGGYDGGAPQQYGGGIRGFNSVGGSYGVAGGVGESYFGGAAAQTNGTAESYDGGAPHQYVGSGGFNSGGGSYGLAGGVGDSYSGGVAAGTNVIVDSGFRSSGGLPSVPRFLLWFRCGGTAGTNATAESGFGNSYFGSCVGGSRQFSSAARSGQVRMRKTIKQERLRLLKQKRWFRLLKTKKGCRLLLKSRFLQKLHSSMQEKDLERTKTFRYKKVCLGSSFSERNRMKRNFYNSVALTLSLSKKRRKEINLNLLTRTRSASKLIHCSAYCYKFSVKGKKRRMTRQRREPIKRIELPTHFSEVNYRTLKAVVYYGPNIYHIPHDIRLKSPNFPLRSGSLKGRGQNI